MLALLQETASQPPLWLQGLEALGTAFQGFLTPILIAVGGGFAWYRFIRQGEHDPRLQLTVAATTTVDDGVAYVVVTATAQNTGLVNVTLDLEPSALDVYKTTADDEEWNFVGVADVFEGHDIAQPNEIVQDQHWLQIELDYDIAIYLELTVAEVGGLSWVTSEVINLLTL